MNVFESLTNNVIINEKQGYAFYFYHNGNVISKTNGVLKDNNNELIDFNSNFRLASVTKQFIAFAIVQLVKDKKINYKTRIKEIFPSLPDYFKKITIKNLLNHTSGIYDYEDIPHHETDPQIVDIDILKFLEDTENTYFEPGNNYRYSNTGYILLGLIVEKISNISLKEYIEKEVLNKAKMKNSVVNIEGISNIPNRSYGHLQDKYGNLFVKDQYWCSATIGDGGIYSSVNDLKKWCQYLVESEEFLDMKIPNHINDQTYNEYGLGIRIVNFKENEIIYHCGDTIGTNTLLLFSKDLNLCLIFLTNLGGVNTSIMKDNLIKYLNE